VSVTTSAAKNSGTTTTTPTTRLTSASQSLPSRPGLQSPRHLLPMPHSDLRRRHREAAITHRCRAASHDSIDDEFISRMDNGDYDFGLSSKFLGESPTPIKLKPRPKRGPMFTIEPPASPNNALGSRYDFGSSLSAALSSAQDKLGRQSGLMGGAIAKQTTTGGGYFGIIDRKEPAKSTTRTERPDHLTTDRPAIGSDQYKDLVQKFCYFTPTAGKGATSPQPRGPLSPRSQFFQVGPASTDGAGSGSTTTYSSGSSTPVAQSQLDGASERSTPTVYSPYASHNASPTTAADHGMRSTSPGRFGYPYQHRDGYLSEAPTPTAIQG